MNIDIASTVQQVLEVYENDRTAYVTDPASKATSTQVTRAPAYVLSTYFGLPPGEKPRPKIGTTVVMVSQNERTVWYRANRLLAPEEWDFIKGLPEPMRTVSLADTLIERVDVISAPIVEGTWGEGLAAGLRPPFGRRLALYVKPDYWSLVAEEWER